jgi:MYXO-CTERM domain-containing protein
VNLSQRHWIVLLCLALGFLLVTPASGAAEGKFESRVRVLRPSVPGLGLKVVEDYKRLELENKTGGTVIVEGYDDEPYLRFRSNGVVERNALSPATYLNVDRFGAQDVPPQAKRGARPSWRTVADEGRYAWFDHRIHLTVKSVPRELRNAKRPKKVFDWEVPLTADGRPVQALGTLSWDPSSSSSDDGFPFWIAVALGALALVGIAALALLRRRRPRPAAATEDEKPAREAW